jgi:hypothetical protein
MRKCVVVAALMAVFFPMIVAAQTPPGNSQTQSSTQQTFPEPGKWFVNLHGGGQVGSRDVNRSTEFDLYDDRAQFGTAQEMKGGGLFDVGGGGRFYEDYGLGVSYTRFRSAGQATFTGSFPNPLFFNEPKRSVGGAAPVEHTDEAVHIQALWFVPYTDKIDFTVGIGPSFFKVKQGFIRGIMFSEVPPDYTSVTVDTIDKVDVKESGVGFNIGGTMTYAVWKNIGASAMVRYSRGSLTFPLSEGQSAKVTVGGFQLAGGVGVRFATRDLGWPWW